MLHALLHMAERERPMTSDELAVCLSTNPVVVRRTMAGLREAGLVASGRGHGGGWTLARPLEDVTMRDIYAALGEPMLFQMANVSESPGCLVEQAVKLVRRNKVASGVAAFVAILLVGWALTSRYQASVAWYQEQKAERSLNESLARLATLQMQRGQLPFLHVISSNTTAHALYEKLGFRDYKETVVRVVEKSR